MKLRWTASAERDLVRLHAFLVTINAHAAAQVVRQLVACGCGTAHAVPAAWCKT